MKTYKKTYIIHAYHIFIDKYISMIINKIPSPHYIGI